MREWKVVIEVESHYITLIVQANTVTQIGETSFCADGITVHAEAVIVEINKGEKQ